MEIFLMSSKARKRLAAMSQVQAGKLSLRQAGDQLGISYRQVKRCWQRFQQEGDRGLVHRLRGAKSNRQQAATLSLKEKALTRYGESYADYGPTLAAESLAAEGIVVAVSTLRQAGISDLAAANKFLEEQCLEPFNAKFSKPPREANDVHRAATEFDLPRILAVHEERVVQNDWTLRWENRFLQLGRESGVQPKHRVTVVEPLTGPVRLFVGERELSYETTCSEPQPCQPPRPRRAGPPKSSQGRKPSATHPWRGKAVGQGAGTALLSASPPSASPAAAAAPPSGYAEGQPRGHF